LHWSAVADRRLRCPVLSDHDEDRPDRDDLSLLDHDLRDLARGRRGDLDRRLVGLDLDERLVLGDLVPFGHEPAGDLAFGQALAEVGKLELVSHVRGNLPGARALLHLHELDLAPARERPYVSPACLETRALVEPDRALVERGNVEDDLRRLVIGAREVQPAPEELAAEPAAGQVGPQTQAGLEAPNLFLEVA